MNNATRIGEAVLAGWSFRDFRKSISPTSRHSVWIKNPNDNDWYCEKVNVKERDWVKALLDEAGVP